MHVICMCFRAALPLQPITVELNLCERLVRVTLYELIGLLDLF